MSDPDDIHNASNTAYFFVVFRLAWYIIVSNGIKAAPVDALLGAQY